MMHIINQTIRMVGITLQFVLVLVLDCQASLSHVDVHVDVHEKTQKIK